MTARACPNALGLALTLALHLGASRGAEAPESVDMPAAERTIEEVVVTGSRIPRTGFETLQPAVVLDREQLALRGNLDLGSVLNEQAGFAAPDISPIGDQGADTIGQSFVDYLGLGQQRTLTLVNGRRFPAGVSPTSIGGLSVDLNMIPEHLVDRIETIAVGGAPVYGSDAVAGTVNVLLRKDFEGLELSAQTGTSPQFGDGGRSRASATWGRGLAGGRGNLALAFQYAASDGLKATDRPATATDIDFASPADPDSPFRFVLFEDLTVAIENVTPYPLFAGDQFAFNIFGNGIPLDIDDPASPLGQFDADGLLLPFVPGGGTGDVIFQNGGDGLKLQSLTSLFVDSERYDSTAFFNFDLTDTIRLSAEAWYARHEATEIVNQPSFNSPAFGGLPGDGFGNVNEGPIPVLIDNPFLPDATRSAITAALDVVHDRDGDGRADPTIDTDGDGVPDAVGFWRGGALTGVVGDDPDSTRRELLRGVLGLEGDFTLRDRRFRWDAYLTVGRTESRDRSLEIIQPRFEQAIQVTTDANGQPICVDPSNGCVPLNVIGTPSLDAVRFVSEAVTNKVTVDQRVFAVNIAGEPFELPAGPVGAAAGFHYREEGAEFAPSTLAQSGLTRNPRVPLDGEFDSTEFYLETTVPLLGGGRSRIESLLFEGAVRFVDHSVAGSDTTWTAGLRFRPVPDLELRGNRTESIRAPSITELFTPESRIFVRAQDPCDERFVDQGNVPATRGANCTAAGIDQPFQSIIVNAGQPGTLSGNENLDSEIAESYTYGLVLTPGFLDGFTLAVDWFDIEIVNAIENATASDILQACYDSDAFPQDPACALFARDPGGQVVDISTGFVNIGLVEFAGLQTVLSYALPPGRYGDLTFSLNHLHTHEHLETPGSGNTVRLDGEIGRSKDRVTATATWARGDWRWFNQVRWLSSAVFDNADEPGTRDIPGVPSWWTFDTSVAYAVNDDLELQLNIDNLFDEPPPFPATARAAGTTAYFSGVLGRYASLTLRARF